MDKIYRILARLGTCESELQQLPRDDPCSKRVPGRGTSCCLLER